MGIVEKIKKLCDDHSTNFAELERRVGLSNGQIRRWDKVSPKTDSIQKVADYFHVSIDYLLGRKEQSEHTETDLAKRKKRPRTLSPAFYFALIAVTVRACRFLIITWNVYPFIH